MTDVVTAERVIPAPAAEIFALLANPSRHRDIDGSGTVRDPKDDADERLELGSQFGMSMVMGLPYSMRSTVVEFEPDRRIAWQTRGHGLGRNVGGRIWRYELEPVEGGTLVRESWDITQESALTKPLIRRAAKSTAKNMAATLERIEQVLSG
jgi:uncharacterized protein YndB with AHSA1/START domain